MPSFKKSMHGLIDIKNLVDEEMGKRGLNKKSEKSEHKKFIEQLMRFSILTKNNIKIPKDYNYIPASIFMLRFNYLDITQKERELLEKINLENEFLSRYSLDGKSLIYNILGASLIGYHQQDYEKLLSDIYSSLQMSYEEEEKPLDYLVFGYEIEDGDYYELHFDLTKAEPEIVKVVSK